jgi:hypothetical protein
MTSPLNGEMVDICMQYASTRLGGHPGARHMAVYSWPQQWPNSCCGFRGVGMQAHWVAPTIVIAGPEEDVCVFHNGRFVAHLIDQPIAFREAVAAMKLPGHSDKAWQEWGATIG